MPLARPSRRPASSPLAALALAAAALALTPTLARAWQGETSAHGAPLRWPVASLPLPIAPEGVSARAVEAAFRAWESPGCGPRFLPPAASSPVRLVVVREGWSHEAAAAAYTSVDADPASGRIRGVLIELNAAYPFVDTPSPPGGALDPEAVLLHEAGHALGLGHSRDRSALMFPSRRPGALARRPLSPDDREALCTIYPRKDNDSTLMTAVPLATRHRLPGLALVGAGLALVMAGVRRLGWGRGGG